MALAGILQPQAGRTTKQINAVPPQGLRFDPAFLSTDEERGLLAELERLEFRAIVLHGVPARRTARHFGLDYDYERRAHLEQAEPLPPWLEPLRARCAALASVPPEALVEALVQCYPVGATLGWHRDAPSFGIVVGVSLGSSARLRFRRGSKGQWATWALELPPWASGCAARGAELPRWTQPGASREVIASAVRWPVAAARDAGAFSVRKVIE